MKGEIGNKERKIKGYSIWFMCRRDRNKFWILMRFNDIY